MRNRQREKKKGGGVSGDYRKRTVWTCIIIIRSFKKEERK